MQLEGRTANTSPDSYWAIAVRRCALLLTRHLLGSTTAMAEADIMVRDACVALLSLSR